MMEPVPNKKLQDIHELNLSYLFCLRELAREDVAEAALRFGVDQGLAQALADASIERIKSIAEPAMLQFRMRATNQLRNMLRATDDHASLLNAVSLLGEAPSHE